MSRLRYRKHAQAHDAVRCLKVKPTPDSSIMMKILTRAKIDSFDHDAVGGEGGGTKVSETARSVNEAIGMRCTGTAYCLLPSLL